MNSHVVFVVASFFVFVGVLLLLLLLLNLAWDGAGAVFFRNLSDFGIFTRNGLLSNSLLFFSSDNGGAGAKNNRPLRGKKEQVVDQ